MGSRRASDSSQAYGCRATPRKCIVLLGSRLVFRAPATMDRNTIKALTAELLGTFLLTFSILASVQNTIVIGGGGNFWLIVVSHAMALGFVAWVLGPISGGHVNPAVSLALLISKQIKPVTFALYVVAQLIGGFLGAALTHAFYFDFSHARCKGSWAACGLANERAAGLNLTSAFFVELFGTFILCLAVLATTDKNNKGLENPIAKVTLLMLAIALPGSTMGKLTGFAINPARDFAPRIFASILYGSAPWTVFAWVPVVGPLAGGALAAIAFMWFKAPEDKLLSESSSSVHNGDEPQIVLDG